jgi:hypothetical protein
MTTTENLQAAADSVTWNQPLAYVRYAMAHPAEWPLIIENCHKAALTEDARRSAPDYGGECRYGDRCLPCTRLILANKLAKH